ncbi:MAG TPA: alpha/beta hydrolase [Sphingomicrobium sp.]|nr:alpha/beta hydrolase [Sphingomicrobium sp.]
MFDFQSSLIFPTHAVPRAGALPPGAERLALATPDGGKLAGVHIPPDQPSGEKRLVLGFGGNAWNAQDVAEYLHGVFPDVDVVVFHYRGYSPSSGSPSATALIADAPLVYDLAVAELKPDEIVAVGFSIGSAVAATLAGARKLDGLIVVTPFDSLKALAQGMYPWLPIGPFFEHQIDAAAVLEKSPVPVAIIAAGRDEIVHADRTDALRRRVKHLVFDRTIQAAGHNDIYARSDFQETMREALTALTSSASA